MPLPTLAAEKQSFLTRSSDAIDVWLGRYELLFLISSTVLFFISAWGHSHAKEPWLDEVILVTLAKLPSLGDIWDSLNAGVNVDPPLMHTIVHVLFKFLPNTVLVARIPAMIGYWAMSLSFYFLVRRYLPLVYAAAGMLLPCITFLRSWAWEARPYGLMLGCSALCLLCWDGAANGRRRILNLVVMTLALAATVSLHFFGVLLLGGLAAGELGKILVRRRIDWASIVCIGIGTSPMLVWRTIMQHDFAIMRPLYVDKVLFSELYGFWEQTLYLAPVAAALLALLLVYIFFGRIPGAQRNGAALSEGERFLLAASIGFLLLPIATYIQAHFVTGVFNSKYIMLAVFGPMIMLPLLIGMLGARSTVAGLCLLAGLGANTAMVYARGFADLRVTEQVYPDLSEIQKVIPDSNPDVIVPAYLHYLPLHYNARSDFRDHLYFLYDPLKSLKYTGAGNFDMVYQGLEGRYPGHIQSYESYVKTHRHFYLLRADEASAMQTQWMLIHLERIGARERYLGRAGMFSVFDVELPPVEPASAAARQD